jgi:hypothetical protein
VVRRWRPRGGAAGCDFSGQARGWPWARLASSRYFAPHCHPGISRSPTLSSRTLACRPHCVPKLSRRALLSPRKFAPLCHPGLSPHLVIPEFRVSEISGIQGPQTRAQPGAPGSRLCAPALSRACFGRDDKRRHVKPAAHTGRRGNTLGVTRTFAPPCHPGISRSEISGIQGPQTRAQPRGPRDAQTARRRRHAHGSGLLGPGSARRRLRAIAAAGMTQGGTEHAAQVG